MTQIYNRNSEKQKRQQLRKNRPKAEYILWQKLRNKQIENCKFRSQYSVAEFVIDFYCAELKLAIEIDGESHFIDGTQEYDRERQAFIEATGIQFIRFTNNDVYENLEGVLEIVRLKVRELRQ